MSFSLPLPALTSSLCSLFSFSQRSAYVARGSDEIYPHRVESLALGVGAVNHFQGVPVGDEGVERGDEGWVKVGVLKKGKRPDV